MSTTAAMPANIWEQDSEIWKKWILSSNAGWKTIQQYKRAIIEFQTTVDKPITEVTEEDIVAHQDVLLVGRTKATVQRRMAPIKAYWRFAQQHEA